MATNRALNITRLSCFGIIILTPRVVMKMMTRKELSAAWEHDRAAYNVHRAIVDPRHQQRLT